MAEPSGTYHISGGQQNFGAGNPSFSQVNHNHHHDHRSGYADEFGEVLALLQRNLETFADQPSAREQLGVIERELARGGAGDQPAVRTALEMLAGQVAAGTTLADAITRAIDLAVRHWPF